MVLVFGLIAVLISLPLGIWGAYALTNVSAKDMDFDVTSFDLPLRTLVLQGFSALLVPALVALFPIIGGSRLTVHQAIQRTGLSEGNTFMSRLLACVQGLPPMLNLALRNVFRKWARMILTLIALALGGAIFISVLGVRQSLAHTIAIIQRVKNYDVESHFSQLYSIARLEREAHRVPGVVAVEARVGTNAYCVFNDARMSSSFPLIGVPPATKMTQAFLVEGRWLQPGDQKTLVINLENLTIQISSCKFHDGDLPSR